MAIVKTISPKGEFEWVTITGEGKENLSGTMQYLANIVLDPEKPEVKAYIKELDDFWAENRPKNIKVPKSMGYYEHTVKTDETDEDGEAIYKETGKTQLSFKTSITYKSGDPKVVHTYNSKGVKVQLGTVSIGNGSIGQIAGGYDIYTVKGPNGKVIDAGVTLYLDAVKISKLVEYADDAGFEADDDAEDGFTGDEGFEGAEEEAPAKDKPRL